MSQVSHPLFERIAAGFRQGEIPSRTVQTLAFAAVAGFAAIVLYYFHDRFWWAPDGSAYAHVAARILDGEVLNRDVQDIHAGYINFANALWLWLFGLDLVSLRYPLAVMAVVQTCLIYRLLLPRGMVLALAGSLAMTTLSVVQFLNPSAHWYALFVFVLVVWALTVLPRGFRWRLEAIGYLIVTMVLFRQLSGALAALGVLAYLLAETPDRRVRGNPWLGRALILVMMVGLAGYLYAKTGILTLILFGVGPLGALIWTASVASLGTGGTLRLLARLALGGAVALAPLVAYHVVQGSLTSWLDDTVLAALHLTSLAFMGVPSYAALVWFGAGQVLQPATPGAFLNGLFWIVLPLLPLGLGVALARGLFRAGRGGAAFHPLPFLAVFYAVVSAHYQIPIYLFFTTAITLGGLLIVTGDGAAWRRRGMAGTVAALSAIGLWYQAGQPIGRGFAGIIAGERVPFVRAQGIARASLWITAEDARDYGGLIALIERETPKDAAILALPFSPELYFLSGRRNPTRFFTSGFGIRDERGLRSTLEVLRRDPPLLVFHRTDDKYNTPLSDRLMEFVRARYEPMPPQGGFDIFRYRPRTTIYRPQIGAMP